MSNNTDEAWTLDKIISLFKRFLELIVAILAAIIIVGGILINQLSNDAISLLIGVTLGLLAATLIRDRRDFDMRLDEDKKLSLKVEGGFQKIENLLNDVKGYRFLDIGRDHHKEVLNLINDAGECLDFLTWYGASLKVRRSAIEEAIIKRGCKVRIVMCSPDKETVAHMALRDYYKEGSIEDKIKYVRDQMKNNLDTLLELKKSVDDTGDKLIIRTTKYTPSLTITISDPGDGKTRKAYGLVRAYKAESQKGLSIIASDEEAKMKFFFDALASEFQRHWDAGEGTEITELPDYLKDNHR